MEKFFNQYFGEQNTMAFFYQDRIGVGRRHS